MSLTYFHRDLKADRDVFDPTITWGETQSGAYQTLPILATQREIDYGTVLGVDTFMHVPFIKKIGTDLVITYQLGLEDEDAAGQNITMKYIDSGGTLSSRYVVIPALSNAGSTRSIIPINNKFIEYNGSTYYLASIIDVTSGVFPVQDWQLVGILAVERTSATTSGTPFWVWTPDGIAVTPQSGFPAYSFNGATSDGILSRIQSTEYQLLTSIDNLDRGIELGGLLKNGALTFTEISSVRKLNTTIRISRNFNFGEVGGNLPSCYFDFGDGLPVISDVPSSPARQHIEILRDGRIAMMGGGGSPLNDRLNLWFAVADKNTLNFRQENIYRVIFGEATGQQFPGAFKNGLWSYPHFFHDTDNKIKIVCSKYKEGIFLFEFDYANIAVTT